MSEGPVDIQQIVFAVCESGNGGCACKVQKVNLAASGFGAQPRGARCDERYSVALAVLCAIVKAPSVEADELRAEASRTARVHDEMRASWLRQGAALLERAQKAEAALARAQSAPVITGHGAETEGAGS